MSTEHPRRDVETLGVGDDWTGVRAVVTGFGVSGFAAADTLQHLGASVTVLDERVPEDGSARAEQATLLETLGVTLRLEPGATATLPDDVDLVVTSPGWRPESPALRAAAERGVPVWGEVELAWRLRGPGAPPWLCVTGTNGKTTTVQMLDAILRAAGLRSAAVGNVGRPVLEAVMDPEPLDVLAVELSSFQLHWSSSLAAEASAVLNIADDHLDWHGTLDAYAHAKGRVYENVERACVYNVEDPRTEQLVRDADVQEGARAIGFTLGVPAPGMLGVVDGLLADRAFAPDRQNSAAELGSVADLPDDAPHTVANAIAAAALAAPRRPRRRGRRRPLRRRLQGHQPPRRPRLAARRRVGRVDRRGARQGRPLRGARRGRPGAAARRGAHRHRPRRGRGGAGPTRAGCARHGGRRRGGWPHGRRRRGSGRPRAHG